MRVAFTVTCQMRENRGAADNGFGSNVTTSARKCKTRSACGLQRIEFPGALPLNYCCDMKKSKPDSTMPALNSVRSRQEGGRRMRTGARPVSPFVSIITVALMLRMNSFH